MKKITVITIFALVVVLALGAAYAQFAKPEDAIKYRKAVMVLILQHFKGMGAVVKGKADYDKDAFAANADAVNMLATLSLAATLVPGSDKGDTTINSAAFKNSDQFIEASDSFKAETAKLADVANGGNLNSIRAQFGRVAQSCSACHKKFRKK
jgi:cytochrome c556